MVVVPGDSLLLAPLAAVGGVTSDVSKTGQQVKRDVEKRIPEPKDVKPTEMALPSPETIIQQIEMVAREILSKPLHFLEGGIPSPRQGLGFLESQKPFETIQSHVETFPTPYRLLRLSPLKDIIPPLPRDFLNDVQRGFADIHMLTQDQHQNVQEHLPVIIENSKQAQADLNALRIVGVELAQAGAKTMIRVGKSLSSALQTVSEEGIAGLIF